MSKKVFLAAMLAVLMIFTGCAEKQRPVLQINNESVTSIEFKKTCVSQQDPDARTYVSKTVTEKQDVDELIEWAKSLKLKKQDAIEIPVEQVDYVIVLNGVKEHKLIFLNEYVVLDTTAYTYENPDDKSQASEKYNLLNYEETETQLNLM